MAGMASGYGQYCPLSLAAELLCQRWTLLVVSRILSGCARFNEIHRGLPKMSPSLLSRRLDELEVAGIVRRRGSRRGGGHRYELTQAGRDLRGIVESLAIWGQGWARDLELEDLDPGFLVWSMHARIDSSRMPPGTTVVEFAFTGAPAGGTTFWLVHRDGTVEMCLKDPGLDVDLVVASDLRLFVEAWRGFRDLRHEVRIGRIRLVGDDELRAAFPDWLRPDSLAAVPRRRSGRERELALRTSRRRDDGSGSRARTAEPR